MRSRLSRSLKVTEIVTDRSATGDFLLTFHGNHGPPISYTVTEINGDFYRKSQICPTPAYLAPPLRVTLEIGYRRLYSKTTRPRKKYPNSQSRFDTINECNRRTDGQTDSDRINSISKTLDSFVNWTRGKLSHIFSSVIFNSNRFFDFGLNFFHKTLSIAFPTWYLQGTQIWRARL